MLKPPPQQQFHELQEVFEHWRSAFVHFQGAFGKQREEFALDVGEAEAKFRSLAAELGITVRS